MGRQSAGKSFIKGVARTWPDSVVHGIGPDTNGGHHLAHQLNEDNFKGKVIWSRLPDLQAAEMAGTLYFPAPLTKDIAHLRNMQKPAMFSLMGITHTLSSTSAMDLISDLIMPPFKPWDALICTSKCAHDLVTSLHANMADWWRDQLGNIPLNKPALPVIPLGVDVPRFATRKEGKTAARHCLGIQANEVVFLFSGRLTFHAKANPIPMYQALEAAAKDTPIVCIEAGIFPNPAIQEAYVAAQQAIAPLVRFIWVNGQDEALYQQAWEASDVFLSLSDNIQETFGLTPIEAKAAGLPVIVADWNGYKDTVRDGVDGFRVPTILPPSGAGQDLAIRQAFNIDSYDFYIGRTSLATVVDPNALAALIKRIATDADLRTQMGTEGMKHAQQEYDWPLVLNKYRELSQHLTQIRQSSLLSSPSAWPQRADPFKRFSHFSTSTLQGNWIVQPRIEATVRLKTLLSLNAANYGIDSQLLNVDNLHSLIDTLQKDQSHTVNTLLKTSGNSNPSGVRALMWLWKFDLIHVTPNT